MKNIFNKSLESVSRAVEKSFDSLTEKYSLVKELVNDLPVFVSTEKTNKYNKEKYDEKHYFVVPFMPSSVKIVLHTMRCLPEGVPEVNNLPKRRVFHFPNEHSEALVRKLLVDNAKTIVEENHLNNTHTITSLANDIDKLDRKLTYGILVIGGMAAIINPVVGAGIAVKALLPGIAGLLNKYGLRPAGEVLNKSQLQKKVKEAEALVLKEFKAASTIEVINPILQELEFALRTTESQHDPLLDFDLSDGNIAELDGERWRELTYTALFHVYNDVINDSAKHEDACLGPEDIRWLKVILNDRQS